MTLQAQKRNIQTHLEAIYHSRTARTREVDVVVRCNHSRRPYRRQRQKGFEVAVSLVSIIQRAELAARLCKQARGLHTLGLHHHWSFVLQQ